MEQANEVQQALSRTYGLPDDIDEADLEAELDALGDDVFMGASESEEVPSYLQEPDIPSVPTYLQEPGQTAAKVVCIERV